jgi:hypothetical protein
MRQPEAVRSHATSATLMNKTMWDPAARKSLFDRFAALEPTAWACQAIAIPIIICGNSVVDPNGATRATPRAAPATTSGSRESSIHHARATTP